MAVIRMIYVSEFSGWDRWSPRASAEAAPAPLPSAPSAAGAKNFLSRFGLLRNRRGESLPPICCAQHGVPFAICGRQTHRHNTCFDCGLVHAPGSCI